MPTETMRFPLTSSLRMKPTSASSGNDRSWPLVVACGLVHRLPCCSLHAWSSMDTDAVLAPVYSPVMLAATHFTVGWPSVFSVTSPLEPAHDSFSGAVGTT